MSGDKGYKYVRATFSNALTSLSAADIEIRDVKTEQLYSVEKVELSTDGLTADITIAGDASVAGTTFLQPSTFYSCKIDADGARSTLEFQLPAVWSDMLVTSADIEKNKIKVWGPVRKGNYDYQPEFTLNVGDAYAGNLGELVGHTVVVGIDADNNITSLKVNDGDVVFGFVEAKDGDNNDAFSSSKDYFQTASGDKYYLSAEMTSTTSPSLYVFADNEDNSGWIADGTIAKGNKFEYAKMILNPNGTVSAAVVWRAFDGHIIATEADGSVAKETSNNSKDFKGYTVIDGETFNYLDPKEISDGDIIYFDTDDKLAFIYNENVEGTLKAVYEDKLDIDGTRYNFIVWTTTPAAGDITKQARYYDADNDEYKKVTEKWANTLDKTEPVTIFLDTKGDGVLVAGEVGATVSHKKQYIITKSPKAYISGLSQMMDMSVSDGTEVTLHINAADITSMNGDAFGDVEFTGAKEGGVYEFAITDKDGKKTGVNPETDKYVKNFINGDSDDPVASTVFQQGGLVEVTYNDDETKVTGLDLVLGNQTNMMTGTDNRNVIPDIQMKEHKDVEFKGGLASIKTDSGSLNLTANTKVYVLSGTRLPIGVTENDGNPAYDPDAYDADDPDTYRYNDTNDANDWYKEATDNKVKVYNYSDFDKNTQIGTYELFEIETEADEDGNGEEIEDNPSSNILVGSLVRFVADGTTATAVVIDDRGWNNGINANDEPDHVGTVRAVGDVKGGQVFKTAETVTKVLGVAKSTEYQLNSDGETPQLAEITIITTEGDVTLDNIDNKIDTTQTAKNHIVLAELDATGKVTKLKEFAEEIDDADVEAVNFGRKVVGDTASTDTLTVTSTDATYPTYEVKADTDCLVLKYNGSSYSESTIGDINRDTDYKGIKFYTSQLNGGDVKAKVIVAVKNADGAGYTQEATSISMPTATIEAGDTIEISVLDQFGEPMNTVGGWASSKPAVAKITGTYATTNGTIEIEGLTVGTADITSGTAGLKATVTVTAPEDYTPEATSITGTLTVTRDSATQLTISGGKLLDQYGVAMAATETDETADIETAWASTADPAAVQAVTVTGATYKVTGTKGTLTVTVTGTNFNSNDDEGSVAFELGSAPLVVEFDSSAATAWIANNGQH